MPYPSGALYPSGTVYPSPTSSTGVLSVGYYASTPAPWLWELVTPAGVPIAEVEARNRVLSLVLNDAGSASFDMELTEAEALAAYLDIGQVDLRVSRKGVALFRGPILGADVSLADVGGTVTFAAVGLWALFADRYTDAPYSILATEQTTVAWTLIANSQAKVGGDLGVVQGSLPFSHALDVVEWQTPSSVKSAVEGLAKAENGFDFSMDPSGAGWRFDAYYPRRGSDRGVVLERGRNLRSAVRVAFDAGPGLIVTDAKAIGQGGVYVESSDAGARALFRRREAVVTVDGSDASSAIVLGDRATGSLITSVRPLPRLDLLPGAPDATMDSVSLGDIVHVALREGWLVLDGDYRVQAIEARPDDGSPEALTLTVAPYP